MHDLRDRLAQLMAWAAAGPPAVFWLAGLSHPSALLSAVLQVSPGTVASAASPARFSMQGHWLCTV